MNGEHCPWEEELLEALGRGFTGPELLAHVASCGPCRELQEVAGAFLDDRATAMSEAPVPPAGAMWRRMQVRRRQEAETRAHRTLLIGQAATLLVAMGLVIAFFGGDMADTAVKARHLITTIRVSAPLLLVAASMLIAPLAGWVALRAR